MATRKHPEGGKRVRRVPPAVDRADRQMRALRFLPTRVPHLPAVERGNGFAAGQDLPDEDGRGGTATINETWVGHFDACLGCMACMTACPSGVDYAKLIEGYPGPNRTPLHKTGRGRRGFGDFCSASLRARPGCSALLVPVRLYQKVGARGAWCAAWVSSNFFPDGCRPWRRCCRRCPRRKGFPS